RIFDFDSTSQYSKRLEFAAGDDELRRSVGTGRAVDSLRWGTCEESQVDECPEWRVEDSSSDGERTRVRSARGVARAGHAFSRLISRRLPPLAGLSTELLRRLSRRDQ